MKKQYLDESFELLQQFLSYMQNVKGRSENTVNEYFISLRTFFRYMKKHKGIVDENIEEEKIAIDDIDLDFIKTISFNDISYFMNYCISTRNNGAAARARKSCAIRVFFNFLYQKLNLIDYDPSKGLDTPKLSKKLPKFLSLEQSIELLNTIDGKYKERDYCILTLFLNCGMRLSELVGINLTDINYEEKNLRLFGKGSKERIVYLNEACISAIKDYLPLRPNGSIKSSKDKNALFISRNGNRISPKTVQWLVKKYLSEIGLTSPNGSTGYSVHKLRHTAATLMYQHGNVDIRILKDILGHESLSTTEIYTHLSSTQMEKAAESNPLAKVKKRKD